MNLYQKTAVITGAASGIGRALAARCARENMRLVLADIEEAALALAADELRKSGAHVLALQTDVSRFEDVEALANAAYAEFGAVHLLFNNAGVGTAGAAWKNSLDDWNWVLGVNLWGVIHGINAFIPRMIAQDQPCSVVNTASIAGLITGPGMSVYNASKHAVIALSETLYYDLAEIDSKVKVSVLCPAWVKTRIMDSARNRPAQRPAEGSADGLPPWVEARRQAVEGGLSADYVADCVFEALQEERFYVFTHPEAMPLVKARMEGILNAQNPVNPAVAALKLAADSAKPQATPEGTAS